jgi:uroporphyrin-III C-methyltransferase/precorrin-2 dehydrogenase/sirohydrochlorin ferrochelatase
MLPRYLHLLAVVASNPGRDHSTMERFMTTPRRRLDIFPAFHAVDGRRVVIVGDGAEAAAKVRLVAETSANIQVFAEAPSDDLLRDVVAADARLHQHRPADIDFVDAALAFIATGDAQTDLAVRSMAKAAGTPVNVVDRPELCDFHTPALVNRAPLAVAIGTGGAAPVLARHIRTRIESMLAPAIGELAGLAERSRARVAAALPSTEARRRFWSRFFSGPIAEKVFEGRIAEAEDNVVQAMREQEAVGHVSLVGAGPGATDLLTLRAHRALQEADLIVYDQLVPEDIVAMGRRDAERICVGKPKGAHSTTQNEINEILVREAKSGRYVVRLKSGDPLIFGRAGEEIDALREAGVALDIVPGITAAFAAAAETEIPLTLRGVASSLVFVTGHDANGETLPDWADLAVTGTTVAVYMGLTVAAKVAGRLIGAGLEASTPVAIIENASRPEQRSFIGQLDQLGQLASDGLFGPALFLIGDVVAESRLAIDARSLADLAA